MPRSGLQATKMAAGHIVKCYRIACKSCESAVVFEVITVYHGT